MNLSKIQANLTMTVAVITVIKMKKMKKSKIQKISMTIFKKRFMALKTLSCKINFNQKIIAMINTPQMGATSPEILYPTTNSDKYMSNNKISGLVKNPVLYIP